MPQTDPQPVPDTRTLREGDLVDLTKTRPGGTVVSVDSRGFEVRWTDRPQPWIESYPHNADGITVERREPPLPTAFGALVEADVPHPDREGVVVRTHLARAAAGHWESQEGWRFSDAYLSNVRVNSHGVPVQAAGLTPAGELVVQ